MFQSDGTLFDQTTVDAGHCSVALTPLQRLVTISSYQCLLRPDLTILILFSVGRSTTHYGQTSTKSSERSCLSGAQPSSS